MSPAAADALAECAEDARQLVHEHERSNYLRTVRPGLADLRDLADKLDGLAMAEDEPPECEHFEGVRWAKMSQAERRRVLNWLTAIARETGDNEKAMGIDAVVEALQAVCETEGVL